jgi:hypothetical protein
MIKPFVGEEFVEVDFAMNCINRYAISNFGRVVSFKDKFEEGKLMFGSSCDGYRVVSFTRTENNKKYCKNFGIGRLVAKHFLPPPAPDQKFIIRLDHNKTNDHFMNLRWANQKEVTENNNKSPRAIEAKKKQFNRETVKGHKLTATKVMYIKKLLAEPNRKTRLKILAKRFGVTEMTLHRIRTGENWGHVKI